MKTKQIFSNQQTESKLRIIPLGGTTGVTKNMYVYEYYYQNDLQDIIIVDCGIGFPKEQNLGVDLVIPDITYLKNKTKYIRAILLTHGHEDHISALPYHYADLGKPPIFATKLTKQFLENKFAEFGNRVHINEIDYKKTYEFGVFQAEYIHLTHSIPDTAHIFIKTPAGNIYHGSDFKFDLTPPYESPPDFAKIIKAGQQNILCLLTDCLGVEREGMTLSEKAVGETFIEEMRKTKGKFFMTTFSSNISRIRQCMDAAAIFNRKVVFVGRSMKENTKLARDLGYLPLYQKLVIKEDEAVKLPPNKLCIIVAGSQGQFDSALSKISQKRNPNISIQSGDKIIFSSDPIPGNEDQIYSLIETLSELQADVVYSNIQDQLHASGHGNQDDLKILVRLTNPKFIMPIGGTLRHQYVYQKFAKDLGYGKDKIIMLKEGETIWFENKNAYKGERIETKNIYVDAESIGDVGNTVLQDRKTLAEEGFVNVILLLNNNNQLVSKPQMITRGFVFTPNEKRLFTKAEQEIEKILKNPNKDYNLIRKEIDKALTKLFMQEKGRSPLIVISILNI
ncbi:MAG: ribonuclease J [Patescibacteria group bacterium]|nr:MAG: ribonuclease J [Patescibacteria group bacterium]